MFRALFIEAELEEPHRRQEDKVGSKAVNHHSNVNYGYGGFGWGKRGMYNFLFKGNFSFNKFTWNIPF